MKTAKGSNGSVMLLMAAFLVLVFGSISFGLMSYFSYANMGAEYENGLAAKLEANKASLGSYSTRVVESAQIANMGTDAQMKIIKAANEARYGATGSGAVVQMIQEQNPQADISMLKRVQEVVEAGRVQYEREQKEIADQVGTYKLVLDKPYSGFWLRLAGFPKVPLSTYKVVTNKYTNSAYETGEAEAINMNPTK